MHIWGNIRTLRWLATCGPLGSLPNKAQRNACRGRRCGRVRGGRDGAAAASSQTIVADYQPACDATRRAAGPSGHARGPAALPFLVGQRGEVAVRWASGLPPACTSGAEGGRSITLWDDGIPACSPPGGRAAAVPSDPGPSGGLVRLSFLVSTTDVGLTAWWDEGRCGVTKNFVAKCGTMGGGGERGGGTEDREGEKQRTILMGDDVGVEGLGRLVQRCIVAAGATMHLWGKNCNFAHWLAT